MHQKVLVQISSTIAYIVWCVEYSIYRSVWRRLVKKLSPLLQPNFFLESLVKCLWLCVRGRAAQIITLADITRLIIQECYNTDTPMQ